MAVPVVDHEKCVGCGTCESLCPDCFKVKEDGKSWVVCDSCEAGNCNCQEVVDACPVGAITIQ